MVPPLDQPNHPHITKHSFRFPAPRGQPLITSEKPVAVCNGNDSGHHGNSGWPGQELLLAGWPFWVLGLFTSCELPPGKN